MYVRAERIVNTLDSSLHFTPIALSPNISGLTLRQLLIRGDFIVRVPQPWRSSADHYEHARKASRPAFATNCLYQGTNNTQPSKPYEACFRERAAGENEQLRETTVISMQRGGVNSRGVTRS